MRQEQNSTRSSSGDTFGLAVVVVPILLTAWLSTRREWLAEQGVLEDAKGWTPTVLGWVVLAGVIVTIAAALVSLMAGVMHRSAVRSADAEIHPPLTVRAVVVTLGVAGVTALLVLAKSLSWVVAIPGIVAVVVATVFGVWALAGPAHKAQVSIGAAKHANTYAGYAGSGNRASFVKVTSWTGGRVDPTPETMRVRVGDHFDYRGGQAEILCREIGAYITDLRGRTATYTVDNANRARRTLTLRRVG